MKSKAKVLIDRCATVLEYFIAGILCIGLLYFTLKLIGSVLHLPGHEAYETFEELLHAAFTLVIGVEIIRMLCEHSTEIVFEVLTFALARQIVISHDSAIDNVFGIAALAGVFAIRKYLYADTLNVNRLHKKKNKKQQGSEQANEKEIQPVQ